MKKLFLIALLALTTMVGQSQIVAAMTPDTTGTLLGSAGGTVHTFTAPVITGSYNAWAIEVYVTTTGTHATDSTNVYLQASMDGINYFKLTDLGTPYLLGTSAYYASTATGTKLSSAGTGAVGWVWKITTPLPYRYIRAKITQYKAASILTVNRCKLHLVK